MSNEILIAGRLIGSDHPPYVIAEMSANHNGSLDTAFNIIQEAKLAGVDAVKIQTYRPDTLTLDSERADFRITEGLWAGRTLYELYDWAHTPWEWHKPLFDFARSVQVTLFSSPFDRTAVDLLEDLNAPAYKIASFEATDLDLIRYAASTGKPMLISTGMADAIEIEEAIDAAKTAGCNQLAVLHCVSGYPAPAEEYNLRTLADMMGRFGVVIGLSDHTIDNTTAITAVSLGAAIIEKHFTLDRRGGGPDDSFSVEPAELTELCAAARVAWRALGSVEYGRKPSEVPNLKFRRSLYFVKHIPAGGVVTRDSVRSVRPGYGLPPKLLDSVVGKRVRIAVDYGVPVTADVINFESE